MGVLSGFAIAFLMQSVDRSLFTHLIVRVMDLLQGSVDGCRGVESRPGGRSYRWMGNRDLEIAPTD